METYSAIKDSTISEIVEWDDCAVWEVARGQWIPSGQVGVDLGGYGISVEMDSVVWEGKTRDEVPGWSGSSGEVFKGSQKGLTFLARIHLGPFSVESQA